MSTEGEIQNSVNIEKLFDLKRFVLKKMLKLFFENFNFYF